MHDTLLLLAAVISVPLLLLGLRAVFARRYRRRVQESMASAAAPEMPRAASASNAAAGDRTPLALATIRPAPLGQSGAAEAFAAHARATTRAVERAVVTSTLVYGALVLVGVGAAFTPGIPLDARFVADYLVLASILLIVSSVLSFPPGRIAAIGASYAIVGIALTAVVGPNRMVVLASAQFELFLALPMAGLALLILRRLRRLLVALAAVGTYLLITVVIAVVMADLGVTVGEVRWWLWPIGLFNVVAGLVVFAWLLPRPSVRAPVVALAAAASIGAFVEWRWRPDFPVGAILVGLAANVLQFYMLWRMFRVFIWFHDRHFLPRQILHAHLLFGFLAAYLIALLYSSRPSLLFGDQIAPLIAVAAAYICQAVVLHVLLRRIWQQARMRPGTRLLLLRTFGTIKGRERLLDALENTWRRVGRVDLIGAADLAMETLESRMLEAFLLQRLEKQFIRTEPDRLAHMNQLRTSLEGDLRYPINEIYCQGAIWQRVVRELAEGADAVLMDVRGFTIANEGCVFELRELVHRVPLRHIVLLADETTDMEALGQVSHTAWLETPAGSPNAGTATPELRVLRSTGRRATDGQALVSVLFEAAADARIGLVSA